MGNQVEALRAANIPVATINSNTQFADRDEIIKDLSCGKPFLDSAGVANMADEQKVTPPHGYCMSHLSLSSLNHSEGCLA